MGDPGGPEALGEILLDRERGREEVGAALVRLLGLPRDQVVVVEGPATAGPPGTVVACGWTTRRGSPFPTRLSLRGPILLGLPLLTVVAALGRDLGCRCLVHDSSADPRSWLLVAGDGSWEPVRLEPEDDQSR